MWSTRKSEVATDLEGVLPNELGWGLGARPNGAGDAGLGVLPNELSPLRETGWGVFTKRTGNRPERFTKRTGLEGLPNEPNVG